MPAAPAAISTPIIADQALYDMLNGFLSTLPEDFYAIKSDKLAEELASRTLPITHRRPHHRRNGTRMATSKAPSISPSAISSTNLDQIPAEKDARIVVLVRFRSSWWHGIMMALRLMGYTNVVNLNGGLNAWKAASMPVAG